MLGYSQIHPDAIYEDFKCLRDPSYVSIIRFFDHHEAEMQYMDFDQYLEIYVDFLDALFESGAYSRFLNRVDLLIEKAIEHNVFHFKGKDIYTFHLFRKAAALYNTKSPQQSLEICKALLKMNPEHKATKHLVYNNILQQYSTKLTTIKFLAALSLIASSIIIAFELLYLRRHALEFVSAFELVRNLLFGIGVASIAFSETYVRLKSFFLVKSYQSQAS